MSSKVTQYASEAIKVILGKDHRSPNSSGENGEEEADYMRHRRNWGQLENPWVDVPGKAPKNQRRLEPCLVMKPVFTHHKLRSTSRLLGMDLNCFCGFKVTAIGLALMFLTGVFFPILPLGSKVIWGLYT